MFKICCGPPTTPLPNDIAWWARTDKAFAGTPDVEVVETAESPNVEAVETAGTADVEGVADTCTSATAIVVEVSTSESVVDAVCGGTAEWAVEAVVKGTDCEGRSG